MSGIIAVKKDKNSSVHSEPFQLEILPSHLPVRALLEEAAREYPDWKKMPAHIRSIEDIFEGAKELVTSGWSKKVITYLAEKCRIWADELPHKPEYDDEAELLRNPELLEQKLKIHQFGALESLRKVLPLAWQELILMASERQLAAIVVARHWIKELSPERTQEIVQTSQVHSIKELELFIDCAAIVGKYIDQAYVRQIELTDAVDPITVVTCKKFPGQKEFKCEFHPFRQTPKIEIKPYRTVFSLEWEHLVQALEHVARKVDYAFSLGELSESYRNFSAYVRELAQTYGSTEINHDILHERWGQLLDHMRALAEEGCPIMLVPQAAAAVIGEKSVVDIELRVGFITSHTKEFTKKLKHYRDITNLILSEERPFFAINHSVPPIFATYQPFAFGPNVYWTTRGERDEKEIMAHTNAVIDVAMTSSFPLLKKMFGPVISEYDFKKATLLDNSLHELGHLLATRSDGAIHERIGDSAEVSIAEELKADSGDMKLVMMAEHTLNNNSVNPTHQLLAKIGDILDYLKNKSPDPGTSGERYYYDGLIIIIRLFQEGCLFEEQGLYHIKDSRRAIEVIAHINDELTEIYLKKEEEELKRYIKINQEKKIDERVQRFITALLRK